MMCIKKNFILLLWVCCIHTNAQNTANIIGEDTPTDTTYKSKFTPFPFIAYSPDTRLMLGAFLLIQFKPSGAGPETRPSNIQLSITYTLNKQIAASSLFTVILPGERWVWNGEAGYRKFPKRFWGIGPNTVKEDELKVNFQEFSLQPGILRKIRKTNYLGPLIHLGYMYDVHFQDLNAQPINLPKVPGAGGSTIVGLGLVLNWDKRDNILTPTNNHFLELSALLYAPFFQSEYIFKKLKIDFRKYLRIDKSNRNILALQSLLEFSSGQVPFEELGMIGGEYIMRGYIEGRFRDKNSMQMQIEYRRSISDRFGAVVFGGLGEVMPRVRNLDIHHIKWAVGAGMRYNINKADPTFIRLDYGIGKNTSGLYITFGEAF